MQKKSSRMAGLPARQLGVVNGLDEDGPLPGGSPAKPRSFLKRAICRTTNERFLALHHEDQSQLRPRMPYVKKKILAIDIVDVTVIAVSPLRWPRIDEHKCVAAVLEPRPALHDLRTLHGEMMASSKLRSEPVFRNATTTITGRTRMIL